MFPLLYSSSDEEKLKRCINVYLPEYDTVSGKLEKNC